MTASLFGVGTPINANVNGTLVPQSFVGTAGQVLFNITSFTYTPGTNSLLVFINGQKQILGKDFGETSASSFTLAEGVQVGDVVEIIGFPQVTLTAITAGSLSFTQSRTGAVLRTGQAKFSESVSVLDFGALGNGVTDDTAAIQLALNSGAGEIIFPVTASSYIVSAPIKIPSGVKIRGQSMRTGFVGVSAAASPAIKKITNTTVLITTFDTLIPTPRDCIFYVDPIANGAFYPQKVAIENLSMLGAGPALVDTAVYFEQGSNLIWRDSDVINVKHALRARNIWLCRFEGIQAFARFTIEVAGTSVVFYNCLTGFSPNLFDGFHLTGLSYSALIGCGADSCHESSYTLAGCWGTALIGCGSEGGATGVVNAGSAIAFQGGNVGVSVTGFLALSINSAVPTISTGNGDQITIQGMKMDTGNPALTTDFYMVTSSTITCTDCVFKNGTVDTPTINFPGANASEMGVFYFGHYKKITALQALADTFFQNTWVPVLSFSFVSTGITYSVQSANYTIRGGIMEFSLAITLTSKGAAAGSAIISGLPLASRAGTYGHAIITTQANLGKRCHGIVNPADTAIFLITEDVTSVNITNADFTNTTTITLSGTAQV